MWEHDLIELDNCQLANLVKIDTAELGHGADKNAHGCGKPEAHEPKISAQYQIRYI